MHVYTLHEPDTGELRYIGITQRALKERLWEHLKYQGANYHGHWLARLRSKQQRPSIKPLIQARNLDTACLLERFFIASARHFGFRLTNACAGGEGVFNPAPETLLKRSLAIRKVKGTPEARARAAELARARWADPTFRGKMAASKRDPVYLQRISEASRQAGLQSTTKAAFAARMKASWADPEYKARLVAAHQDRWARRKAQ